MILDLFEFAEKEFLDPGLSCKDKKYQELLHYLVDQFSNLKFHTAIDSIDISPLELDNAASNHCDKWLETTGQHMVLYTGSPSKPSIVVPQAPIFSEYPVARYRTYSGDVSGVIGEALFSLLLTKKYLLPDNSFAHFGANQVTGFFPDFGIYQVTEQLQAAFDRSMNKSNPSAININQTYIIPAEVKSMANPSASIIYERLDKAILQIKNFWAPRKHKSKNCNRGISIIFLALRNQTNHRYDGIFLWMI